MVGGHHNMENCIKAQSIKALVVENHWDGGTEGGWQKLMMVDRQIDR